MIRRPPISTRTYTLLPYAALFRSDAHGYPSRVVTAMRGGRYVLLEAGGTGCPGCPAPGSRARYDDQGRLTEINQTRITRDGGGAIQTIEAPASGRSEEHTSKLQSLMRISYADFCLKQKNHPNNNTVTQPHKPRHYIPYN